MKICIFSDVHGNLEAYLRMLEADGDADCLVFLGDIFGYFYEQKSIINSFMEMKNLLAIKGNHDVNFIQRGEQYQELLNRYGSSYCTELSEKQWNYVMSLPEYLETELDGKRFGIYHGGVDDYQNQRVYPDGCVITELIENKYDYLLLGHTHYGFVHSGRNVTVINPGSLGQPRDGKGFSYCVLDTEDNGVQFKTVEVDISKLLGAVEKKDCTRHVYKYLMNKYGELE